MTLNILLVAFLWFSQSASSGPGVGRFAKPSEAFAYANAPMAEWKAAVKARTPPKTRIAPQDEVLRRAKALCPLFSVENESREELYWLAKLCEFSQPDIGMTAVQRYLEMSGQGHRPEAHLLLSELQMQTTRSWVSAWETLRAILQEDPIESEQEVRLRVAIEVEADDDEATALQWAEERYSLLSERLQHPKPGIPMVSPAWVIMAGADLVHRYYLAGRRDQATQLLSALYGLKLQHSVEATGWPAEELNWANMEAKPAPSIPVLRAFGGNLRADIVQRGRVEVVSFFFLRCAPCLSEMPELDDFQKRYPKNKVLVVDITTYKVALQPDAPSHQLVESAMEKLRRKKSPHLTMALTAEQVLDDYGISSFPVVAVIDQAGRLRYAGRSNDLDSGEEIDRLVRRLLDEQPEP